MSPRLRRACGGAVMPLLALAALLAGCVAGAPGAAPPYAVPVDARARVTPLVTCGARLPLTGGAASDTYVLPGIPDGMGLLRRDGRIVLFVNHELRQARGAAAGPVKSGARISELTLEPGRARKPVSGRLAFNEILEGDPPVPVAPGTRAMSKLCSAFLATDRVGFDAPIYLTGEEDTSTFDGRGGIAFALADGRLFALPAIGRAQWEDLVVLPGTGETTAVVCLEDALATGDGLTSQIYLHVGTKDRSARDPIARNGLRDGTFFTWVADRAKSEADFRDKGSTEPGRWVEVSPEPDAAALEERARAAGAFGFVRIEDGAADPSRPGVFYFVTTGEPGTVNPKGRLYRLDFEPASPAGPTPLTIVLDGSEGIVSPDNIDIDRHGRIAICEDPNFDLKKDLGLERDTSLWFYDIATSVLTRALMIDRDSTRRHFLAADPANHVNALIDHAGGWEMSGVIDAEDVLGPGAWLLTVQAHALVPAAPEVVEGGQILRLEWRP
ncbi:MAG TPA: hypothetical protein VGK89_10025 [Candidatus Eisenbacteria bacterium]|jgi:hypothetical protein